MVLMYAQIIDGEVAAVGALPKSARRLDSGAWVMGLATAPVELVEACGWFPVTNNPPTYDQATQVLERGGVIIVAGRPVVDYTVRAKTAEELAADQQAEADEADRESARQAITNLQAYADAASPTNAQTVAVVKLLCRVCVRLIKDAFR